MRKHDIYQNYNAIERDVFNVKLNILLSYYIYIYILSTLFTIYMIEGTFTY